MEDTAVSGTVTTGPATFAEAFAAEDSSASTTAVDTAQTDSASADATVPPAEQASADAQPQQPGEPPRERWDAILTNAREKAAAEARAQLEQEYGWAKQVDRRAVEQAVQLSQKFNSDKAGYVRELLAEAMSDPTLAPSIRSEAARLLGTRAPQSPTNEPPPMVPVQLEDGSVVQMPRDPQAWLSWHLQQQQQQLAQQFQPVMQTAEQLKAMQQQAQAAAEAQSFAQRFGGNELSKLPHFAELKDGIRAELAQTRLDSDHPAAVEAAAYRIYIKQLAEKVLPTLSQKAQTKLLDNLQQKAAASSGVNPGSTAASTQKRVTSFHELGADAWK